MDRRGPNSNLLVATIIPATFVLLWSTGWIVARFAAIDAEPLTFLLFRYGGAAVVLFAFAAVSRADWPSMASDWGHALLSGILIHALYLGGVWWAIAHGVPASISALLAAMQPILTAILAPRFLGEVIRPVQWAGVILGLAGLLCVLAPSLAAMEAANLMSAISPLLINAGGMISLTLGTFYQKRYLRSGDLRTIAVLQYIGAFAVTLPLAIAFEDLRIVFSANTVLSLAWSIGAISVVSIALLLYLIRKGEVARSAQLIYLVPPVAAIQAFLLFGERFSSIQVAGMVITCIGVALAIRR